MSPWDELKYFELVAPIQVTVPDFSVGPGVQVIGADPLRVLLAFSTSQTFPAALKWQLPLAMNETTGFTLVSPNYPTLIFDVHHHQTLVQAAWFGICTSATHSNTMTVAQVRMHEWPPEANDREQMRMLINRLSRLIDLLGAKHAR